MSEIFKYLFLVFRLFRIFSRFFFLICFIFFLLVFAKLLVSHCQCSLFFADVFFVGLFVVVVVIYITNLRSINTEIGVEFPTSLKMLNI